MRYFRRGLAAVGLVALLAGAAPAQMEAPVAREPHPGAALLAAFANIVFTPVRVAVTAVGAELGGVTGLLTAGNEKAANDVWGLFRGQNVLQPEVLQGREPLRFGTYECRLR
jgi:hypothetical protein